MEIKQKEKGKKTQTIERSKGRMTRRKKMKVDDLEEVLTIGFCELAERICEGQDPKVKIQATLGAAIWVVVKSTLELGPLLGRGEALRGETPPWAGAKARSAVRDVFEVFRERWPGTPVSTEKTIASDWQTTITNVLRRTGDVFLKGALREVREYAKKLRIKAK